MDASIGGGDTETERYRGSFRLDYRVEQSSIALYHSLKLPCNLWAEALHSSVRLYDISHVRMTDID